MLEKIFYLLRHRVFYSALGRRANKFFRDSVQRRDELIDEGIDVSLQDAVDGRLCVGVGKRSDCVTRRYFDGQGERDAFPHDFGKIDVLRLFAQQAFQRFLLQ